MGAPEKNSLDVSNNGDHHIMGYNQEPISSGQGLNLEIVNQYGQLMGDFSKLDDELWLSSPQDDQPMVACNQDPGMNNLSSHEHVTDLEPLLCADVRMNSSIMTTCSQSHSQNLSPSSVLERRPYSNVTKKAMKSTLGKRHHSAKEKSCCRYSAKKAGQSESAESLLLDGMVDSISVKQVRTRKISELLQLHSGERNQNPKLGTAQQPCLNRQQLKTCMHCESSMTPQWRDGPMGPKTLCNACGIQFKFGRLSADYRPLRSPTFDPSLHTNFPNIKKKMDSRNLKYAPGLKRSREMKMDYNKIYQKYTPKAKAGLEMIEETEDLLESSSKLCTNSPKGKRMRMDESSCVNEYSSPNQKEVQQMRKISDGEMQENCALEANSIPTMTEGTSELLEPGSRSKNRDPMPKQILRKKQGIKKCLHCESTRTPQWRPGPMGRNTLCNACGVQYKHGRLFPEYRPLKSPTYDPAVHSHVPKKVLEMRMTKPSEDCAVSSHRTQSEEPFPCNSFTHLFRVH